MIYSYEHLQCMCDYGYEEVDLMIEIISQTNPSIEQCEEEEEEEENDIHVMSRQ